LSKEEGGRHTPFFSGYKPQFFFKTTNVTGEIRLPDGIEMVMPGDSAAVAVNLDKPVAFDIGGTPGRPRQRRATHSFCLTSTSASKTIRSGWLNSVTAKPGGRDHPSARCVKQVRPSERPQVLGVGNSEGGVLTKTERGVAVTLWSAYQQAAKARQEQAEREEQREAQREAERAARNRPTETIPLKPIIEESPAAKAEPTILDQLLALWDKATQTDREQFISVVQSSTEKRVSEPGHA
jgi:hypothetical protein